MKENTVLTKQEIDKGVNFIIDNFDYFNDKTIEIEESEGEFIVHLIFPGDDETWSLDSEEFDSLFDELLNFKVINNGKFSTTWNTYQIVEMENEDIQYYLLNNYDFQQSFELGEIRILEGLDILKFFSLKLGAFHIEYGTFHHQYPVIEIEYHDKRNKLNCKEEDEIILAFLFEISDSTGFNTSLGKFNNPNSEIPEVQQFFSDTSIANVEKKSLKLKPLIQYNEGMNLFVSALQINDETLKFLNFYKVIEYFAPIIVRLEGNSLLTSKLDSPKALNPDRNFIDSIFDLVNSVNDKHKDSELAKSVLKIIDIIDAFPLLPERIAKHWMAVAKIQELNYKTHKDKVSIVINTLSTSLYSTRNWVVHAKSNYQLNGTEFYSNELNQLNKFMKQVTAKIIRWYDKLPKHLR